LNWHSMRSSTVGAIDGCLWGKARDERAVILGLYYLFGIN
jgi:hypothetical protein